MGAWVGGGNAAGLLIDKSRPRRLTNTDARSTTSRRVRCSLSLSLSLFLFGFTAKSSSRLPISTKIGSKVVSVATRILRCLRHFFFVLRSITFDVCHFAFFCDIFALCIAALLGFLRELGLKKKKEIKQLFFLLFFAFFFFFTAWQRNCGTAAAKFARAPRCANCGDALGRNERIDGRMNETI